MHHDTTHAGTSTHTRTYIGILGEDLGILASILKGGTDKNYR